MRLPAPTAPRASTLGLVELRGLERGVAEVGSGVERAALWVDPLNLSLRGDADRDQVWGGYRRWLQHLSAPIAIYSLSEPDPPDQGLASPAEEAVSSRLELAERSFRAQVTQAHAVQRQRHLIVLSSAGPDLAGGVLRGLGRLGPLRDRSGASSRPGRLDLDQQVRLLSSHLDALGTTSRRLSDGEWLELLQRCCGGRSGRGQASFASWIAPSTAQVRARELCVDGRWSRTLAISAWPRRAGIGWLFPLLRGLGCELRLVQHVVPLPKALSLSRLRGKIRGFETSLVVDQRRGRRPDAATEGALQDALALEEQVLTESDRLLQVEIYATLVADSLQRLEECWQELLTVGTELGCGTVPLTHRQVDGWRATVPLGVSPVGWSREITATGLATAFPFLRGNLGITSGVLLGPSLISRELVLVDPFAATNPNFNAIILGTSGGGKSYTAKLLAARLALGRCHLRCIDPVGEYRGLAEVLGGQWREIGPGRSSGLSALGPCRPAGAEQISAAERASRAMAVVELLAAGESRGWTLPDAEAQLLEDLLRELLERQPEAILADLVKLLRERGHEALASRLSRFTEGVLAGIFDGRPEPTGGERLVVLSFAGWSAQRGELLAPAMQMALLQLEEEIRADPSRRRLILVDEAEVLLSHPRSAAALEALSRRVRKWGAGIAVVSQVVEDFLNSEVGNVIIRNSHTKLLLRQEAVALPALERAFSLSPAECDLLRQAEPGVGLAIVGNERSAFQGAAPGELHRAICSDAARAA